MGVGSADREEAKKEGNKIKVTIVDTHAVTEEELSTDNKQEIEKVVKENGLTTLSYIDATVNVYADGEELGNITELESPNTISVELPEEEIDENAEYVMLRIHDDKVDILPVERNGNVFSCVSEKFSIYILASAPKEDCENSVEPPHMRGLV